MELLSFIYVGLAVILSLASAVFSWSCRPTRHRHTTLESRIRELETDQADLMDGWQKCLTALKKINQREVMRDRRKAAKEAPDDDQLSDEEWKAKKNAEFLQQRLGK